MQTLKRNYDRVFALCIALLSIVVSSVLVMKSFGIGEKFSTRGISDRPDPVLTIGGNEDVMAHLETEPRWDPPLGENGRRMHALVSAPVFIHDGKVVAAYDGPPIRGEVPNRWLIENGLPIERSDVLQIDSDGDRFSNDEEYHFGNTDPNDANSHPDVLHKLTLLAVRREDCVIHFASAAAGQFSIRKIGANGKPEWRDWFEIGDALPGGRFKLVAGNGDSITIGALVGDGVFVLKKRAMKNLPVYSAEFSYVIEPLPIAASRSVRGDSFKLGRSGIRCTVEMVAPEAVTLGILRPDGKSERITLNPR